MFSYITIVSLKNIDMIDLDTATKKSKTAVLDFKVPKNIVLTHITYSKLL